MATWMIWVEGAAALYLIVGALIIDAASNIPSKFIFKIVPMCIGLPLAFAVAGHLLGWPGF